MLRKNNVFFGFAVGLLVSAAVYGLMILINNFVLKPITGKAFLRESTEFIFAAASLFLPVEYYTRHRAYKTARGLGFFFLFLAGYLIWTYFGTDLGIRRH